MKRGLVVLVGVTLLVALTAVPVLAKKGTVNKPLKWATIECISYNDVNLNLRYDEGVDEIIPWANWWASSDTRETIWAGYATGEPVPVVLTVPAQEPIHVNPVRPDGYLSLAPADIYEVYKHKKTYTVYAPFTPIQ